MQIQTSRFGAVTISNEDLILFPEGILGFNDLRNFVLLEDPSDEIFAWLQSCENPGIAFPVLEPELFATNYTVSLTKSDLEALSLKEDNGYRSFTIVTIPQDPTKMTANLKAPLVINVSKKLGRQCVLQDNKLAICEPIFTNLQQRLVQNKGTISREDSSEAGVIIRLPATPESGPDKSL